MLLAAVLTVVVIVGGVVVFLPRTGKLNVYVAGPSGRDVGPVDIYVDKERVCASSPCSVPALTPGIHDVYAEAKGYAPTATKGVEITAGSHAKFEIALFEAAAGFKVAGSQRGITLHVDGKEVGPLPQELSTLLPGEHELRFVGSDRYEPLTRTITVVPNKVEDLGEIKLEVVKGLATFELATTGARMRLVPSEGEARELDEGSLENRRLSMELDTSREWKLEACSIGYDSLELPISFADGQAEKTFRVELVKNEAMDRAHLKSWCHRTGSAAPAPALPLQSGGKLSFNSIPPSAAVLLDGKPVGRTPMAGVVVGAGTHSVVFVHPEKGRKATSVTVGAGQTKGVGVRF
jgi:serine/threonine-protein kinase